MESKINYKAQAAARIAVMLAKKRLLEEKEKHTELTTEENKEYEYITDCLKRLPDFKRVNSKRK